MKIILNAIIAKRETTGGFQVTKNFFYRTLSDEANEWYYFVSKDLDDDIKGLEKGVASSHYFLFPTQPDRKSYLHVRSELKRIEQEIKPDVIYSILAPCYFTFSAPEVMRLANAWSVVDGVNKYARSVVPFKLRLLYYWKSKLTQLLMRKTDYFVTQSEIAKHCILKTVNTKPENVCVVTNVLPVKYQKVDVQKIGHEGYDMIYVAAPARHKDILLLPHVASILVNKYKMSGFKIHVTIPFGNEEALNLFNTEIRKYDVEEVFVNHGYVTQDDLISLYPRCDLGLFPSLLETFSATLLEYMYFQLPIVASDLDFNREVAVSAAEYFKPHDAEEMATKIYNVYSEENLREALLEHAKVQLAKYSNNTDKYGETVSFLQKVANKELEI